MKKFLLLFALIILSGLYFYFTYENKSKKRELITELSPLKCDLNKTSCEVDFKGNKIIFDINPKPLKILEESKVIIKNLPKYNNLNAKLYGLNMYMGDIIAEFDYKDGIYSADIVFSSCIESTMRYRFELFDGGKSLDLYIDFDVKR